MSEFYEDLRYRLSELKVSEGVREFIEYEIENNASHTIILQFVIEAVMKDEQLLKDADLILSILKEVNILLLKQNRFKST